MHSDGHRALDFVVIELARRVAVCHPGALHGMRLGLLVIVERVEQAFVIFVKQSVPDQIFQAVAVGCDRFVGICRSFVDAGLCDKIEQALPLALV
jgi:hypothetical protein